MLWLRRSRALLVVAAVILLAEVGARALSPRLPDPVTWDNPFTQAKVGQMEEEGSADVVFLGSSVVNVGIDPARATAGTGRSGYNAALPGSTPILWRAWAADAVIPLLCPAVVVIGVTPRDYNDHDTGNRGALDQYLSSPGRLLHLGEAGFGDRAESAVSSRFTLAADRSLLRQPANVVRWLLDLPVDDRRDSELTGDGRFFGFDDHNFERKPDRRRRLRSGAFRDFAVGGLEEGALRGLIGDVLATGAVPVIVEMPVLEAELVSLLPGGEADMAAFRAGLDRVATLTGHPVLRFPDLHDRKRLFADEYHLNGAGVTRVSDRLAEELRSLLGDTEMQMGCG